MDNKTKESIKERDDVWKLIHLSPNVKLSNRVSNQIQKDYRHFNETRIDKAGDEKEIWKFTDEVI